MASSIASLADSLQALQTTVIQRLYSVLARTLKVDNLAKFLSRIRPLPLGTRALAYVLPGIVVLGVVKAVNRALNSYAMNNWSFRPQPGWQWDREIAVVTGGCSGIGKALVQGLVEKGVTVAIIDIQDLPDDMRHNTKVSYWKADITSPSDIHRVSNEIRKTLGDPSILINNAGVAYWDSILDTPQEKLERIFGINLFSMWILTKEFLPAMVQNNKGHIITMSSLAGSMTIPGAVHYSATKAGALAFHEGLRGEIRNVFKAPNIMTTAVQPAWVRTAMTSNTIEAKEMSKGKMLSIEYVSGVILTQIFSCRGGHLIIPDKVSWVSGIKGWPNWMQERARESQAKA